MVEGVVLRPVRDSDLDALFDQRRDPASLEMAAFTPERPDDRRAFDAHMASIRSSSDTTLRCIVVDDHLVGTIGSYVAEGKTEVTYWIERSAWGRGIASQALVLFLDAVEARPLHARVASDNVGSLRVLQKNGFRIVATETSYASGRGAEIEESLLELG